MDNDKKKLKYEGKCHKKEAMRRKECNFEGKKKSYTMKKSQHDKNLRVIVTQ